MDKIQQYKEILEQAPEGATHVDVEGFYIKFSDGKYYCTQVFGVWRVMEKIEFTTNRKLSDLQTIVDQAETIERLKVATDNSKVNASLIEENERLKARIAELDRHLEIAESHLHDEHFTYYVEDCEQPTPPEGE